MATPPRAASQEQLAFKTNGKDARELWLRAHGSTIAAFLVIAGFLARLWTAHGIFLNPDEALHFRLANQASLSLAYQQSLTAAHPPLLILLLYFWRVLGTSDLWLRMTSVLAGTIFCWMFFKWATYVAGKFVGLLSLFFAAFLPPLVVLSAEVRQYALLLGFLAAALYLLERAFAEDSIQRMIASALCLYGAMLSHYSAFLFAVSLGLYAIAIIYTQRPPLRIAVAWAVGQIGGVALAVLLYIFHLSKLGAGDSRQVLHGWMSEYYLSHFYFKPGRDNPLAYAVWHSFGVFQFIFGHLGIGDVAGVVFLVGIVLLVRGRVSTVSSARLRPLIWLLTIPFVMACLGGFGRIYPYGGTRHVAILTIPALVGVSMALAWMVRGRWERGFAIAFLVVVIAVSFGKQRPPSMNRGDQSRANMIAALNYMRQNIPTNQPIFVDYQTDLIFGHYLCEERPMAFTPAPPRFEEFSCGGYRVICADYKTAWMFSADNFPDEWALLLQNYGFEPGDTIWIFQTGWGINLPVWLRERYPEFRELPYQEFGRNIKVFKLTVGQPIPAANVQLPTHVP